MIGFDMDYTLLKYRKQSIGAVLQAHGREAHQAIRLSPELDSMVYDPAFVVRGLVVDKRQETSSRWIITIMLVAYIAGGATQSG